MGININYSIFVFLLFFNLAGISTFWTEPHNTYLFAPGLWSSEHQVGKYCQQYIASTGQIIQGYHAYDLINGSYTIACNFPEIAIQSNFDTSWPLLHILQKTLHSCSEYIIAKSNRYHHIHIINQPSQTGSLHNYLLAVYNLNFAQKLDIQILSSYYDKCISNAQLPQDIIGYGVSRGAAALFNFIATEYHTKSQHRIKALVLESCFDSIAALTSLSPLLSIFLPYYQHYGIAPIRPDILHAFVQMCIYYDIPVLLISSHTDQRVPYTNTQTLYQALRFAGLQKCFLLTLYNSTHSCYLKDNDIDAILYQTTVHSFYKENNLSYRPDALEQFNI